MVYMSDMQTYVDASDLEHDFGFVPKKTLKEGLRQFAVWYRDFYCR